MAINSQVAILWSYILDYENSANPDADIRDSIAQWKRLAKAVITEKPAIIEVAKQIHAAGIGVKDALHLACALEAKVDYFITTDKKLIRQQTIQGMVILNPVEFIRRMEEKT